MPNHIKKRKSRAKTRSLRLTVAVFAIVLAVAAVGAAIFLTADPALNKPAVKTQTKTDANGVSTTVYTETHKYYTVEITTPDRAASPYPAEMQSFIDGQLTDFHSQLEALRELKKLDKKTPGTLNVSFTQSRFGDLVNYTVIASRRLTGTSEGAVTVKKLWLADSATGAYLSPEKLFSAGFNYKQLFAQTLVNQMKALSSDSAADFTEIYNRYATDDSLYAEWLYIDENGVNLMTDSEQNPSVPFVTAPFKSCYKSLSVTIPEEYLPKLPTPIDPSLQKVVALTFDDGPNSKVTPKLLDLLDKYNAKATFFLIGYNIDYQSGLVKELVNRGHCVGNHSTKHDNYNKMTVEQVKTDVNTIFDKLESILGKRPHLLRPPGGALTKEKAAEIGAPIILWDVDPLDWKYRDAKTVSQNILKDVRSGDIVLSHDLYESTYEAMETVLPALAEQGYRFVTVDELLGINDGNYEYYAGKIITYRTLVRQLREDGLL